MIEIREIKPTRGALGRYTQFQIDLYRGNPCYVPPLVGDDVATLMPGKNPAFDFCEARSWMAFRDGKAAGRITGIVNRQVNERTGRRDVRFGFVDFVDDAEVVDALFAAVAAWGRSLGMEAMVGPMGFTDMDHEGMLTYGFDEMGTMATIYNHAYYPEHMARMGFATDAEWVEYRLDVPAEVPEQLRRVADIVSRKYGLRTVKYTSGKKIRRDYGQALFELINRSYDKLYGYSPLTPRQIDYYIGIYLPILRLDYVSLIVDGDGKLVGVGISLPSMSRALRRCRGRLFPLGWYHLLRAMHARNDTVDLLLVGVAPEYQNKGVNSLLFTDLLPLYIKNGVRWTETNIELADNTNVQQQWKFFDRRQHRRRAVFRKLL